VRALCAEHGEDLAPALDSGLFYHVTCTDLLDAIGEQGLQPTSAHGQRNFPDYHIEEDCVYLFPSIGNAQCYAYEHDDRFEGRDRAIVQAEGLDYALLAPDQEEFARQWEDGVLWEEDSPIVARVCSETGLELGQHLEHDEAAQAISRMSVESRLLLTNSLAEQGDGLMLRSAIPPSSLSLATLNDHEAIQEAFDKEHPELDPWDGDEYDEERVERHDEAFEAHLQEMDAQGLRFTTPDELREHVSELFEELAANQELSFYRVRPLAEALSRPEPEPVA
jgi:hypothetical protein